MKRISIALATAYYLCLVAQMAWATTPPPGFVDASTYGYNTTDATSALQAAINTGNNVFVPNLGTPWYVTPITLTQSNQEILFQSGAVVAAKPGAFLGAGDALFTATDCTNVSMVGYGATLTMQKNDYTQPPYSPGQWRSAIDLYGVSNFAVQGLSITNTGGDGVFVSNDHASTPSQNVTIKDTFINNAYRNGISVISVNGLLIDNSVIVSTSGSGLPQAGIDFEPDYSYETISNFTVRNTILNANAGPGIQFYLEAAVSGSVGTATGTIENVTIVGNGTNGIQTDLVEPGVTIKDSLVGTNTGYGLLGVPTSTGWATGEPRTTITDGDVWDNASGPLRAGSVSAAAPKL